MRDVRSVVLRWILGLGVVAALGLGAEAAFAFGQQCPGDPGVIGACPPYTQETCDEACFEEYGTFGDCVDLGFQCCLCAT